MGEVSSTVGRSAVVGCVGDAEWVEWSTSHETDFRLRGLQALPSGLFRGTEVVRSPVFVPGTGRGHADRHQQRPQDPERKGPPARAVPLVRDRLFPVRGALGGVFHPARDLPPRASQQHPQRNPRESHGPARDRLPPDRRIPPRAILQGLVGGRGPIAPGGRRWPCRGRRTLQAAGSPCERMGRIQGIGGVAGPGHGPQGEFGKTSAHRRPRHRKRRNQDACGTTLPGGHPRPGVGIRQALRAPRAGHLHHHHVRRRRSRRTDPRRPQGVPSADPDRSGRSQASRPGDAVVHGLLPARPHAGDVS